MVYLEYNQGNLWINNSIARDIGPLTVIYDHAYETVGLKQWSKPVQTLDVSYKHRNTTFGVRKPFTRPVIPYILWEIPSRDK